MHKFAVCTIEFDPISNIPSWRSSSSFLWEFFQSSSFFPILSNLALSAYFIGALLFFCAWVINANTKLAVCRADMEGPILPTLSCSGLALGSHQCLHEQESPCCRFSQGEALERRAAAALGAALLSLPSRSRSVLLLPGCFAVWRRKTQFCLFYREGLCSLPPVPSVSMPVIMFSLPILYLLQLNRLLGRTIPNLYTVLISVKFCSLWKCLVKVLMWMIWLPRKITDEGEVWHEESG